MVLGRRKANEAREKILVAGGPSKYEGLRAYVRQFETVGVTPTVLVTDDLTASRLLEDLPA